MHFGKIDGKYDFLSEAASYTMRHVLSLPLFSFPFALDYWKRGWVMSPYHVDK